MKTDSFVLGVDFGTDSVRALVVGAANGDIAGSCVVPYRRWAEGLYCDPVTNRFRQHPLDYLESMAGGDRRGAQGGGQRRRRARRRASPSIRPGPRRCSRIARHRALALARVPGRTGRDVHPVEGPHVGQPGRADHRAGAELQVDFTKYEGGVYSSEWFWAKVLRVMETNPRVAEAAVTVLEHCDWIPAVLTGTARSDQDQAQPLRRRAQGDVARRVWRLSVRRVSRQASSAPAAAQGVAGHRDLDVGSAVRHRLR